jgi:hypothetical protein
MKVLDKIFEEFKSSPNKSEDIDLAFRSTESAKKFLGDHIFSKPPTTVAINRSCEVVFEWLARHRSVAIYFSDFESSFIMCWGQNVEDEMADGEITKISQITNLIEWVYDE